MDPLTPDRWQQIEALFSALADSPPDVRAQALAEAAATDPELAATVASMLAHDNTRMHLEDVVRAAARDVAAVDAPPRQHFGIYRTVREVGRGGMGVVYEAVSDDEYARRVAIKVAPMARIGAAADARFRLERQILSSLDHPHIARFLDGGTEQDLPYFVMEFVEGAPITAWVASHQVPLADRLRLVHRLCGALQYAHQRLVVHRDLKPSNILVRDDGSPVLLDFGVAKLLQPGDLAAPTIGLAAWTPDYASPEQVTGEFVGTQSDVYSLGLVLYEVLTGARAQVADTTSPLALSRSVCQLDPPRPSERVLAGGDKVLARRLRGDLDTIVMTAIHKDPARRYPSAVAVADDIDRYLQGLPVVARGGSTWYRLRKGLMRHRGAVAAGLLLSLALVGGAAATAYQARRADHRFQQVRALANEFVFGVHDRIAELPGSTDARRALVQTALTYLENLGEDASGDPGLAKELAAAYGKIGMVQGEPLSSNLGEPEAAVRSFTRARQLLAPLEAGGDVDARLQLAGIEHHLTQVLLAQGEGPATLAGLDRARTLAERVLAERPGDTAALSLVGDVNAALARTAITRRDLATATAAAERAMSAAAALVALAPGDAVRRNDLATAHNALGSTRLVANALEPAVDSFRQAVAIREALVREAPGHYEFTRALVIAHGNLGDVLAGRQGQSLGDVEGAAVAFDRAVALSRSLVAADANDRRASFDLVSALLRKGSLLADTAGREADALAPLDEADRLNERLMAGEPGSARYRLLRVVLNRRLGRVANLLGDHAAATPRLERARREAATLLGGSSEPNAREQIALSGVELVRTQVATGDNRAFETAVTTQAELAAAKMSPLMEARVRSEFGAALVALAQRTPATRQSALAAGRAEIAASEALWRGIVLPPLLEGQRARALDRLAGDRRTLERLATR